MIAQGLLRDEVRSRMGFAQAMHGVPGGLRYSPTMSFTFAANLGSRLTL